MRTKIRGFTLVELIVLIGIIAILAAIAFPRYVLLEVEARKALVLSLGGSVNSAAQQAHYTWILQGKPAVITMEDQSIAMVNGYPDEISIDKTLMDYSGFQFNNAKVARFRKEGAPAPNTCIVTYEDAVGGNRPAITVDTSGC